MEYSLETDPLVSTEWLEQHFENPDVCVIEVDVDTSSYEEGHVPGAVGWNWKTELQDQTLRDLASREEFQELARQAGVDRDSHVVLYGDNHNWFAAWALWQFQYYGFDRLSLLDGGRERWVEEGRPLSTDEPSPAPGNFRAQPPREDLRAYRSRVLEAVEEGGFNLVDVRSREEFTGEVLAPEGMNETAQRGGHIPGARNITWKEVLREDGRFKSPEEIREIYKSRGITEDRETITYCRIGERSSHTWFVLKHLLGYSKVRNYDGSWTEWGNLVSVPIATGSEGGE